MAGHNVLPIKSGYPNLKMYKSKTCMSVHVTCPSSLVFVPVNKKRSYREMLDTVSGSPEKNAGLVLVVP